MVGDGCEDAGPETCVWVDEPASAGVVVWCGVVAEAFDCDADECFGDWVVGVRIHGDEGAPGPLAVFAGWVGDKPWSGCGVVPDFAADDLANLPVFVIELRVEELGSEFWVGSEHGQGEAEVIADVVVAELIHEFVERVGVVEGASAVDRWRWSCVGLGECGEDRRRDGEWKGVHGVHGGSIGGALGGALGLGSGQQASGIRNQASGIRHLGGTCSFRFVSLGGVL